MGGDPDSHTDRGADTGVRAGTRPGRKAGPLQPRALGWRWLPGWALRRGDTARGADHRDLRRLRGDGRGPALAHVQGFG